MVSVNDTSSMDAWIGCFLSPDQVGARLVVLDCGDTEDDDREKACLAALNNSKKGLEAALNNSRFGSQAALNNSKLCPQAALNNSKLCPQAALALVTIAAGTSASRGARQVASVFNSELVSGVLVRLEYDESAETVCSVDADAGCAEWHHRVCAIVQRGHVPVGGARDVVSVRGWWAAAWRWPAA